MGKGSEGIAINRDSEDNGLGSCEAHHVGISASEDRGGTAGKMGEGKGTAEEGCLAVLTPSLDTGRGVSMLGRGTEQFKTTHK
jgi:hypothetical protein